MRQLHVKVDQTQRDKQHTAALQAPETKIVVDMLNAMSGLSQKEAVKLRQDAWQELIEAKLQDTEIISILSKQLNDYPAIFAALAPACARLVAPYNPVVTESIHQFDQLAQQLPVLESLRFGDMQRRQMDIKEAFASTYDWIFDANESNLA